MRKLSHEEIVHRQQKKIKEKRLPFCVVINNVRSLYNVGSIFRTADGVGVEKIWICGITGYPPRSQITKTALGAEEQVSWEYREDVACLLGELKAQGYQVILLEQTEQSLPYEDFRPDFPICLVIGNEISGVSKDILSYCDQAVEIEMCGIKNSLNVSVAFGVMAYYFRQQYKIGQSATRSALKKDGGR